MSMSANVTSIPDSLFSVLTHLKHEELITGDSDCNFNDKKKNIYSLQMICSTAQLTVCFNE